MLSNLDIERQQHLADKTNHKISCNVAIHNIVLRSSKSSNKIIKSKRFSRAMERILRSYAQGKPYARLPLISTLTFRNTLSAKFNSYDLLYSSIITRHSRKIYFVKQVSRSCA